MPTQLTVLLYDNPFDFLKLPPDAESREIRHRIEEFEMRARLSGAESTMHDVLANAKRLLDEPAFRAECEFFISWEASATFGTVAPFHDQALLLTQSALSPKSTGGIDVVTAAISAWGSVLHDLQSSSALRQRLVAIGQDGESETLPLIIGTRVIPQLVNRALAPDLSTAPALARAVAGLGIGVRTSAIAIADHIERRVSELAASSILGAPTEEPADEFALIDSVNRAADELGLLLPDVSRRLRIVLSPMIVGKAWGYANAGDLARAEALLVALSSLPLPEADLIEALRDLRTIKHRLAWERANEHIEYGEWAEAIANLRIALANAPDQPGFDRTSQAIDALQLAQARGTKGKHSRKRTRSSGLTPQGSLEAPAYARRRAPAQRTEIPGNNARSILIFSGIVGAMVLVIPLFTYVRGKSDSGSVTPSAVGAAQPTARPATPPTVAPTTRPSAAVAGPRFLSDVRAVIEADLAAVDSANALGILSYEQAAGNQVFVKRTRAVVSASKAMEDAARASISGTAVPTCRDSLLASARAQVRYWTDLADAAERSDVDLWNQAVEFQPTLNGAVTNPNTACKGILFQ